MLHNNFRFIWPSGLEKIFFRTRPTRNKNCLWQPCLLTERDEISTLYRGPSIDVSYQDSVHLARWFQKRFFRNWPIRNKNCLWRPCLYMEQDEMSKLYRGPSTDASYQMSNHLAARFQTRRFFFRNQPIRNKTCVWWPCLLMDRDEMSNLYRGSSIHASYQVSIHLAKRFQMRRIWNISQSETRIACGCHVC